MGRIVKWYVERILKGKTSLDNVSPNYYDKVKSTVINHYVSEIESGQMTIDDVPDSPDTWRTWVEEEIINNEGSEVNGSDS